MHRDEPSPPFLRVSALLLWTETTDTQQSVSYRSTTVVDNTYGLPGSLEALSISPLSSIDTEYFTHGRGASSSSGNYQRATPTSMPLFEGFAHHQAFHTGRQHRRSSSASSAGAPPRSPAQGLPMPRHQLAAVRRHHPGRASFDTVATSSPSPISRNLSSTTPTGLSPFEAFNPAYDGSGGGGHRRNSSTSSAGVGAWSPSVWSPTAQQLAVPRPQQQQQQQGESGWAGRGWQEGTLAVEFVSRREPFLHYDGTTDRSVRR